MTDQITQEKGKIVATEVDEEYKDEVNCELHYVIVKLHPDIQTQLDEITATLKRIERSR